MLCKRIIPCLDVDTRPRREGRPVRRPRRRRRPGRGGAPLRRSRRPTRSPSSTSRASHEERRDPARRRSRAPRRACSCRSPSAAACARSQDVRDLLNAGADKVSIMTAAVTQPRPGRRGGRDDRQREPRGARSTRARAGTGTPGCGWEVAPTADAGRPGSTRSSGRRAWRARARARSCSRAWTATARKRGYDLRAAARGGRSRRDSRDRVGRRRQRRRTWPARSATILRGHRQAALRRLDLPLLGETTVPEVKRRLLELGVPCVRASPMTTVVR